MLTPLGSSKKQDTGYSIPEMAVRVRPPSSIIKRLTVLQVKPALAKPMIETEHYLHSMPAGPLACFGVYLDGECLGAVVFSNGMAQSFRILDAAKPSDVVTLARLWLSDRLPKNSESRVLGFTLSYLRQRTPWKAIISYADPTAGHLGVIYQATGWLYLGATQRDGYIRLPDGKLHHPRSVSNLLGSNSIRHLRATGVQARREPTLGKHKYLYILDPSWRWRLKVKPLPYPKPIHGESDG